VKHEDGKCLKKLAKNDCVHFVSLGSGIIKTLTYGNMLALVSWNCLFSKGIVGRGLLEGWTNSLSIRK